VSNVRAVAKANTGPGKAQGKGRSAEGRVTGKGGTASKAGRYTPPVESGRYTPPIPRNVRRSPKWFGALVLILLLAGVLIILLNYLLVLPGSASAWYLVLGLGVLFAGFMAATRYR